MAGTDRTRDCAGERSCIRTGVLRPFRQPFQTSGDFPKEPLDTRDTRAASDGLALQTKPRAALKLSKFSPNLKSEKPCTTNKAASGIETYESFANLNYEPTCTTNKAASGIETTWCMNLVRRVSACTTNKAASGIETYKSDRTAHCFGCLHYKQSRERH